MEFECINEKGDKFYIKKNMYKKIHIRPKHVYIDLYEEYINLDYFNYPTKILTIKNTQYKSNQPFIIRTDDWGENNIYDYYYDDGMGCFTLGFLFQEN